MQLSPYSFEFDLTHLCNNRCAHCFNDPGLCDSESAFISLENACRLVNMVAREFRIADTRFTFTGGEPTLHPKLAELIRYVRKTEKTASVVILTNGRTLRSRAFCRRLYDAGLNGLQITLNSSTPAVHDAMVGVCGAWQETIDGIKNALMCHPLQGDRYVSVTITLTTLNIEQILDTVHFLARLGVKVIGANSCVPAGHGSQKPGLIPDRAKVLTAMIEAVSLAKELGIFFGPRISLNLCTEDWARQKGVTHYACGRGRSIIEFNHRGELYFCAVWGKTIGNVLAAGSIRSLLDSPLGKYYWSGCHLPDKCRVCNQIIECGGICPITQGSPECNSIYTSKELSH